MPADMRLDWYGIESCVESFFATLKKELIFRKKYATIEAEKTKHRRFFCDREPYLCQIV